MNPGIVATEKEKERIRLLKLPTYIVIDYVRSLVHKIERQNEELKIVINKKEPLYMIND